MTTKKPSPTPGPAATQTRIPKDTLAAIAKRLERGETALIAESRALKFTDNAPLRAALRAFLGGKEKYRALIERGMKARAAADAPAATVPPRRAARDKGKGKHAA